MDKLNGAAIMPYNIAETGENDVEINMYGEIVEAVPTDFWTGEPIEGNFIAVDRFLRDLDDLKDKKNITVHINSVGGDLYGGIAIYNRLKALPGNVTTVNDGLAASAGSIIFQAGNTRKVHAGSNIMIHQAMGFLYGYYQTKDLKEAIKQLDAGNKAAVNVYAEASGREPEAMKAMLDKETWLTGQEAVDAGLADEVIGDDMPVSMSLTADRKQMVVNGFSLSTRGMTNIPARIPVMPAAMAVSLAAEKPPVDKQKTERGNEMEIKNVQELRAAYPELVNQIEAAAREAGQLDGVNTERTRIQGIEAIENAIADKELIKNAKYKEPLTAEQLAFKAMQAQAAIGAKMLHKMEADAGASGAAAVEATPNQGPEAKEEPDAMAEIMKTVNIVKQMQGGKK